VDDPDFKSRLFINKTFSKEDIDELRRIALHSRRRILLSPLRLELCYRYFLMRRKLSGNKPLIHRLLVMSQEEKMLKERREKLVIIHPRIHTLNTKH
jgi:hypothetical protein